MQDEEKRMKMAVIAGASFAFKYKEKHPRAQESEVIQHITESVTDILGNIDNPL